MESHAAFAEEDAGALGWRNRMNAGLVPSKPIPISNLTSWVSFLQDSSLICDP